MCVCLMMIIMLVIPFYLICHYMCKTEDSNDRQWITIVTAYYQLKKAKHSHSEYLIWLENFLSFAQSPMIIFTTPDLHPILYRLRGNGSFPTVFILNYASPLQMPPIKPLISTFEEQHETDPERAYHSVELYAIWCAKSYMLNYSSEINPFRTQYFLYVDAGAFRTSNYRFRDWPDPTGLSCILNSNRFLLGMIAPLPQHFCPLKYNVNDGPINLDLIEGTFMAGSINAIRWWSHVYYSTVDNYVQKGYFIGKDQSIMNAIALAYPRYLNVLLPFRIACSDVWFAFGPLFATKVERYRFSFTRACQRLRLLKVITSLETICGDKRNLV